ncbi:hypothetical protein KF728_06655 [Candidatus Obscuribacterales bacterium]|nr:hypothetical protein [Candidatus Obscuribacterales bacterium]
MMRTYSNEKFVLKVVPVIAACAFIAACGGSKTTSESSSSNINGYGESRKVEVSETGDSRVTTETIRTVEPKTPAEYAGDPGAEVTLDDRGIDNTVPSRTHVRAPGVAIDSDENTGEVHVNAPFVRINKDPYSGKVKVKVPFVNINADAND